jgi:hypothetical protein
MSYEHLEKEGIEPGSSLNLNITALDFKGFETRQITTKAEKFAGGGFYGSVLLCPEFVIKTGQPDAFHSLLRQVNWPIPFPSQSNETAARLDHLAAKIIHRVMPIMTNGEIITPDSLGYTQLGNLGYAQVLERMKGRGPTFLDDGLENETVQRAREQIWEVGLKLGLEHAAQVHPHNPFGKPNIWLGNENQIIWLDTLPAFRHTGKVKPFFNFSFHNEVRDAFESTEPTFNQIHTDSIRSVLDKEHSRFTEDEIEDIESLLCYYDENLEKLEITLSHDPRELYVEDALARGLIDEQQAERFRLSMPAFQRYQKIQLAKLGGQAFLDKVGTTPLRFLWDRQSQKDLGRFITDPDYRTKQVSDFSILRGIKNGYDHGLITEKEYEEALAFVPKKELNTYVALQLSYILTSRFTDLITVPLAGFAAASTNPAEALAAVTAFNTLSPGIIRAATTMITGRLKNMDIKRAALISALPAIGGYAALPAQLKKDYGEEATIIQHYSLRTLVAVLSKLRPGGGWGSDAEEKIWNFLHDFDTKKVSDFGYRTLI